MEKKGEKQGRLHSKKDFNVEFRLKLFGRYRIIKKLGSGGLSQVFLAEQTDLGRKVALKLIPPGSINFHGAKERLFAEAKATSSIENPGICSIYETGEYQGIPFIAMQYIEGESLAEIIKRRKELAKAGKRSWKQATGMDYIKGIIITIQKAARILHSAHENGLVHRDIKPGNIVVNKEGDPVILDFGIARPEGTRRKQSTRYGGFIGTPQYMSPEQISGSEEKVSRQTDIYSLGVTLYECLTLKNPFQAPTLEGVCNNILRNEYDNPCRLNPFLPKDIRYVIDGALERNLSHRYHTALDFAEDLARVLEGKPLSIKRPNMVIKAITWAKKNPAMSLLFLLLIFGLLSSLYLLKSLSRAHEMEKCLLNETKALALSHASAETFRKNQSLSLLLAMEAVKKAERPETISQLQEVVAKFKEKRIFTGHTEGIISAGFSPDGRYILTTSLDKTAILWDMNGRKLLRIGEKSRDVKLAKFSPDGKLILVKKRNGLFELWTIQGKRKLAFHTGLAFPCYSLFSPDSKRIFSFSKKGGNICWSANGKRLFRLPTGEIKIFSAAYSPKGNLIATSDDNGWLYLWNRDGSLKASARVHDRMIRTIAISPDEKTVVTAGIDGKICVLDPNCRTRKTIKIKGKYFFHVSFSSDGSRILAGTRDGYISVIDMASLDSVNFISHPTPLRGLSFSSDGRMVLVCSSLPPVKIYNSMGQVISLINGHKNRIYGASFSPDSNYVLTASIDKTAILWSIFPGKQTLLLHDNPVIPKKHRMKRVTAVGFSPDGKYILTAGFNGKIKVWSRNLGLVKEMQFRNPVNFACFSPASDEILAVFFHNAAILDPISGRKVFLKRFSSPIVSGRFTPSGRNMVFCLLREGIVVTDRRGRIRKRIPIRNKVARKALALKKDARFFVLLESSSILVLDKRGHPLKRIAIREGRITSIAYIPVKEMVAAGLSSGEVRIFDLEGELVSSFRNHYSSVIFLASSRDGTLLASSTENGDLKVSKLSGRVLLSLKGHNEPVRAVAFSPDNKCLVSGSYDGTARIWYLDKDELLRLARTLAYRNLLPWERKRFHALLEK